MHCDDDVKALCIVLFLNIFLCAYLILYFQNNMFNWIMLWMNVTWQHVIWCVLFFIGTQFSCGRWTIAYRCYNCEWCLHCTRVGSSTGSMFVLLWRSAQVLDWNKVMLIKFCYRQHCDVMELSDFKFLITFALRIVLLLYWTLLISVLYLSTWIAPRIKCLTASVLK